VEKLVNMGYDFNLPALSSIGYKQIAMSLRGEISLEDAIQQIKYETHRFVRHQYAWFRLDDKRIHWFDIAQDPEAEISALVSKFLEGKLDNREALIVSKKMKFTKLQGTGNDFILIETNDEGRDWSKLALAMCDRHFGIGSDGLLLLLPSNNADFRMRMFDPDGSEAEACGNGIRCLARYVHDEGMINAGADCISVETIVGVRQLRLNKENGRLIDVQAGMGKPAFKAEEIPVRIEQGREDIVYINSMMGYLANIDGMELLLNLVSMGNPHAVNFQENPVADFPLSQIGPEIEHYKIFPRRTNFEVARVINRREIEVRTWERGVGETLACGSGACAVAVAAQLRDYAGNTVSIKLLGGTLKLEWDGADEVLMTGPAETVFHGEWPD
jgi:diaminopimelate epimerase